MISVLGILEVIALLCLLGLITIACEYVIDYIFDHMD